MTQPTAYAVSLAYEGEAPVRALRREAKKCGGVQICKSSLAKADLEPLAIRTERTLRGFDNNYAPSMGSSALELAKQTTIKDQPASVVTFMLPDLTAWAHFNVGVQMNPTLNQKSGGLWSMPHWPVPEEKRAALIPAPKLRPAERFKTIVHDFRLQPGACFRELSQKVMSRARNVLAGLKTPQAA